MKFQILAACSMLAITVKAAPLTLTCEETQAPFSLSCKEATAATGATAAGSASSTVSNSTAGTATAATNSSSVLPDGRIAQGAVATDFNVLASKFKSAVVKGDGLVFSDLIEFPTVTQSLFDKAGNTKAFEITIDDKSIFIPQGGTAQSDIRRADLLPSIASTLNNVATTGVKTMHFSMQADSTKPLNLTHEYQLVFLESADFTVHQFDVKVGGAAAGANSSDIRITGNAKNAAGVQTLFTTPMTAGSFENFAVKMDFDNNTIQVFHSTGDAALTQATAEVANDMTGNGEYHFAVLKNGIAGAQEPIVGKEGIIYGGIFMEDSATGTVTLQ